MKMRTNHLIGFQIATIPAASLSELFNLYSRLIEELGLQAAEILLERVADRYWFDPEKSPPEGLQSLLKRVKRSGAHLPFIYINPVSPEPAIRRASLSVLKNAVDFSQACGVDYVIMHCRGRNHFLSEQDLEKLWQDTVLEMSEYAHQRNLLLSLENGDYLVELRKFTAFINSLNSNNVVMTLDFGHSYFRLPEPRWRCYALETLDRFSPVWLFKNLFAYSSYGTLEKFLGTEEVKINSLHIHDHNGSTDHLPLGKGRFHFALLRGISPHICLIIEAKFQSLVEVYGSHKILCQHLSE